MVASRKTDRATHYSKVCVGQRTAALEYCKGLAMHGVQPSCTLLVLHAPQERPEPFARRATAHSRAMPARALTQMGSVNPSSEINGTVWRGEARRGEARRGEADAPFVVAVVDARWLRQGRLKVLPWRKFRNLLLLLCFVVGLLLIFGPLPMVLLRFFGFLHFGLRLFRLLLGLRLPCFVGCSELGLRGPQVWRARSRDAARQRMRTIAYAAISEADVSVVTAGIT
jgi:hypothetical protein